MKIVKSLLFLSAVIFLSCNNADTTEKQAGPEKLNDGWIVSTPVAEDLKPDLIAEALAYSADNRKLDALIIIKNGKLVVERYANGYGPGKLHKVWSITKAVTATITGIAIDKGHIPSELEPMYKYLRGYPMQHTSLQAVSIEHLLSMTSGFAWKELGGPGSPGYELPYSSDWVAFTLQLPHSSPGKEFSYNTGSYMLFAPIIKNTTGMQADEFAKTHLFESLGINNYQWDKQSEFWTKTKGDELKGARDPGTIKYSDTFAAFTNTGSGLHMLPRDMAKIGQLYLDKGKWNGKQIVSEAWVNKAIQGHYDNTAYGYGWRLMSYEINGKQYPAYFASGFGQQSIIVIPDMQMVVVLAQQHYDSMPEGDRLTSELMNKYILSAAL
ncbi:MAG TPA: serine hydrolase [Flavipsychrobacter sp.]|nr:serine hydrolase [Flavipsychrobacter sp.]